MVARKTARPGKAALRRPTRKRAREGAMPRVSALVGGLLICAALAWFGWLLLRQHDLAGLTFRFPFAGSQNQPATQTAADPLVAAGITLTTPGSGQPAILTWQQALLLANQMEPQAAAHASNVSSSYVLVSYQGKTPAMTALHDVPAWLVHYTHVASAGPDTGADPHAANPSHDCYLFLDANSGQELFALWS